MKLNGNFAKMPGNYLFYTVRVKTNEYVEKNPTAEIIRLGIGDVTRPLVPAVIAEMHAAVEDMAAAGTFKGYGEDFGYGFLRSAIIEHDYKPLGVKLELDEVFINDGAKSDTGNFAELFDRDNKVAVCDPVYPVYVDSNVMAGRAGDYSPETGRWSNFVYLPCTAQNGFIPEPPKEHADIVYLCFPNNPTGAHIGYDQLKAWVDYALREGAVILYDAAYSAFIEGDMPRSIYEIEGAKSCAVEFKSYSKTAGFTGVRCGYTVVPKDLKIDGAVLRDMWARRQTTKFNEASYISQRGAAAIYTPEGALQAKQSIDYYKNNAKILREGLADLGFTVYGGVHSPYVWLSTPSGMTSWEFFDALLDRAQVVGTPGSGFGPCGEGYFRITSFGTQENSIRALERIKEANF